MAIDAAAIRGTQEVNGSLRPPSTAIPGWRDQEIAQLTTLLKARNAEIERLRGALDARCVCGHGRWAVSADEHAYWKKDADEHA